MNEPVILNKKNRQGFMDLIYDFIWKKTELGVVAINECPTDSEHVNRVSIFVCDKAHDKSDLRWADEMKQYFEKHQFPSDLGHFFVKVL
jgi:hypothetical protein